MHLFILLLAISGCIETPNTALTSAPFTITLNGEPYTVSSEPPTPCRNPIMIETGDLHEDFCASKTTQKFPKTVRYQYLDYEEFTELLSKDALNWNEVDLLDVGTVNFAYANYSPIAKMSAMEVGGHWWYMWGETRWMIPRGPREDNMHCEGVLVFEQGAIFFCSLNPEESHKAVLQLYQNIEDVAGNRR